MAKPSQRPRGAGPGSRAVPRAPAAGADGLLEAAGRLVRSRWFPPALLALISVAYFWGFVTTDQVVFGSDIGQDFHKGAGVSASEKLADLAPDMWHRQMGGYPISEEIRHSYFPTYLIYLFTTYQRAIGWRYLLTAFFAGWGMCLYLRQLGAGRGASLWSGVAYMSAPFFLTFLYAGHYAKMGIIALLPWMFLAVDRGMGSGRVRPFLGLSALIALGIFTPHLQMLQYALLATGLYFLFRLWTLHREGAGRRALAVRGSLFGLGVVLGLGLGAEGLFPPYLHVRTESKRAATDAEEGRSPEEQLALAQSWSLHPEEVGSLLVPEFGGFYDPRHQANHYWGRNPMKLNSEYFGVLTVTLALLAVATLRGRPVVVFMAGLFAAALAFTLGGHTPVHWLAFHLLPGGKVLRTVGMAAFLFGFPACVLAGLGLSRILDPGEGRQQLARRVLWIGGAATALALVMALAPAAVGGAWARLLYAGIDPDKRLAMESAAPWLGRGALLVGLVAAAGTALAVLHLRGRLGAGLAVAGLVALALADTWRIDRLFLEYEDPARYADFRLENRAVAAFLRQQELHRVFPIPSYRLLEAPGYHVEDADPVTGFNNYTLRRYDRLIRELEPVAGAFEARYLQGRQVPYSDARLLQAAHPLLNLLNARYLLTPKGIDLEVDGFPEVLAQDNLRVYVNPQALPWFYLVPDHVVVAGEAQAIEALRDGQYDLRQTVLLEREPDLSGEGSPAPAGGPEAVECLAYEPAAGEVRLQVSAPAPRWLVISHNYHPNWSAFVDGRPVPIERADYVWQAIRVGPGPHQVELRYRSPAVTWSRVAAGLSLAAIVGLLVAAWRGGRGGPDGVP
ncbi:MAG: hypothetical protein ABIL09_26475 [Gemmatimonadota bacterium]